MECKRKIREITHFNRGLKSKLKVAIYCRVSTSHPEQIQSLNQQINYYRCMVDERLDWTLADVYTDIKSGKNTSSRAGFQRMLDDCINKKIDLIITKLIQFSAFFSFHYR
ncbi:recombinase family protein [Clostridium tarantellae]|uniref:Resolvase/invertase-type recombinase catalytic domain-containing protein n=1 Tax=Clostridium tarantellae TaxID=39493 RepID=A0A6I1MQC0_9CLOT|nr:recombinase family protein [Clostridium tarantellae]MPQ44990.1 hypothetical protein [Clostridium tarantellae]